MEEKLFRPIVESGKAKWYFLKARYTENCSLMWIPNQGQKCLNYEMFCQLDITRLQLNELEQRATVQRCSLGNRCLIIRTS